MVILCWRFFGEKPCERDDVSRNTKQARAMILACISHRLPCCLVPDVQTLLGEARHRMSAFRFVGPPSRRGIQAFIPGLAVDP